MLIGLILQIAMHVTAILDHNEFNSDRNDLKGMKIQHAAPPPQRANGAGGRDSNDLHEEKERNTPTSP